MGIFSSSEERRVKREKKLTNDLRNAVEYESKTKALKIISKFEKPMRLPSDSGAVPNLMSHLCWGRASWHVDTDDRLEILQAMVNAGFNLHASFDGERNCLHFAADGGNKKIIEYLCGHGVAVTAVDEWDKTPLNRAIDNSRWEVAGLLYDSSLADFPAAFAKTLKAALSQRAPDHVIALFLPQLKGKEHEYLQDAVINGSAFFVDYYLELYSKNPFEYFEDKGHSILMSAIGYQQVDIFKKLLAAGLDYTPEENGCNECLKHAANTGDRDILYALILQSEKDGVRLANNGVLAAAVSGRGVDLIPDLVSYGCNPNEVLEAGSKPLLLKVLEDKNREAAIKLIGAGADVNLADANGMTAMRYIAEKTDGQLWSVIKMLQGEGAATAQAAPRAVAGNYSLLDRHVVELRQGPLATAFNFHTGQVITRDTEHGSLHVQDFDRLPRVEVLIEAEKMLIELKGELPEGYTGAASIGSKKPIIPASKPR